MDEKPENTNNQNLPQETQYGKILPRLIDKEMQESYLDYAMSVIVARALPDVRDGLKPVHRRVMYSMHELGLSSRSKYRKSATVVGDVLGKYHPHGDVAVYDTLVRMAQPFSMRYKLVDGQGNFGSMDGDSPAAMRYTEARMAPLSEEMLFDIEKNTVDFVPNYDGTREEPKVLPAKVPQLLLNGSLGIAVGMATNIPPHNLTEICDGTIHLIDNPESSVDELMEYIKGPDFPTGGNIYGTENIKTAYSTGKGKIVVRAVANIEEGKRGFRIIVSELPYQVNKADLISKIADLVKDKKIEGISDLRDESDRKEGVRIVIELKSNAYPKKILNLLYEHTNMQTAFHVNMLALIDGIQPRILSLKNVLEEFIKHRQTVVRRRTQFELDRAKDRAHILEGLKIALDHIDEVISTIKKSATKEVAHDNLMKKFNLSDKQSAAILEMRLSALAGLERQKIEDELKEKLKLIAELLAILGSEAKILDIIKRELNEMKEKFGDERRTKIFARPIGEFSAEDLIPNEQVAITLTTSNYIKRVPVSTYRAQNRGGKGIIGMETKETDVVEHLVVSWTHDDIMFFTDKGRVFTCKVYDLPAASRQAKGQAIVNVLQISPEEKVTAILTIAAKDENNIKPKYFFMGTVRGIIKKTEISAYQNVRKTGLIAIKLKPKDELKWVSATTGENNIIIISKLGQAIYFSERDARPMGRSASGVRGIRLRSGDEVITMDVVREEKAELFTILQNGYGKRTNIGHFHIQKRGGVGIRASKVNQKTGPLIRALITYGDDGEVVIISAKGQMIRTSLKSVKKLGRDTQGVTLMRLKSADKVASMTVFVKEKESAPVKAEQPQTAPAKKSVEKKATKIIAASKVRKQVVPITPTNQSKKEFKPVVRAQQKREMYNTGKSTKEDKSAPKNKSDEVNYWGGNQKKYGR